MADVETKIQQSASLLVRHGARKGRKYNLKGESFRIGRESSCDLVLNDSLVSPIHTVVEIRGELWVASNRGANGTLINEQTVEGSRTLAPGDLIQVGAETLLEFQVQKKEVKEKKVRDIDEPVPMWRRPAVLVGVGVYLALIVGAGIWLSSRDKAAVSAASASEVLQASKQFLASDSIGELIPDLTPELVANTDPNADPGANFYRLVSSRQAGGSTQDVERLIAVLVESVDEGLFRAWRFEQQRRWPDAIRAYRELSQLVPTIRFPATDFAMSRIRTLETRLSEKKRR